MRLSATLRRLAPPAGAVLALTLLVPSAPHAAAKPPAPGLPALVQEVDGTLLFVAEDGSETPVPIVETVSPPLAPLPTPAVETAEEAAEEIEQADEGAEVLVVVGGEELAVPELQRRLVALQRREIRTTTPLLSRRFASPSKEDRAAERGLTQIEQLARIQREQREIRLALLSAGVAPATYTPTNPPGPVQPGEGSGEPPFRPLRGGTQLGRDGAIRLEDPSAGGDPPLLDGRAVTDMVSSPFAGRPVGAAVVGSGASRPPARVGRDRGTR
jgi:hypothetical protein